MFLDKFRFDNCSDRSFCMSINNNRYEYMCKNFKVCGLDTPKLFRGVRWNNGSNTGCVLSHLAILMMARCLNYDYVIIYEDDSYPRPDLLTLWEDVRKYIPIDCGILKFGSSSFRGDIYDINKYICRIENGTAFGSHSYAVCRECYDILINTMMDINIPDGAMDWKYYLHCRCKPYCLNSKTQFFIQKNIGIDNIIANKGGQRYWYPSTTQRGGITSGKPPLNFRSSLLSKDEESKYLKNIVVIRNKKWLKGKKTAIIDGDILYTKDENGTIKLRSKDLYEIIWDDKKTSTMKYDGINNDTKFYTILDKD